MVVSPGVNLGVASERTPDARYALITASEPRPPPRSRSSQSRTASVTIRSRTGGSTREIVLYRGHILLWNNGNNEAALIAR